MDILLVSGSVRKNSTNRRFLFSLKEIVNKKNEHKLSFFNIDDIPLFHPDKDIHPYSKSVLEWKSAIKATQFIIISTPAYLDNIPAILKNSLEWLSKHGELANKKILPISFTPSKPRGANVLQSLCWTLKAMNARVEISLELDHNDVKINEDSLYLKEELKEVIKEVLGLYQI